jgi:DNA-binding response OmpR family regulator
MMPIMSGWQFLTERGKDSAISAIPVAVISASSNFRGSISAFDVAASLSKPIDFDRLLETVQHWTRKSAVAR